MFQSKAAATNRKLYKTISVEICLLQRIENIMSSVNKFNSLNLRFPVKLFNESISSRDPETNLYRVTSLMLFVSETQYN